MPLATCYRFVRCQVHRAFDDVQGWFLEVRAGDSELLAAFHRSLTSKYHLGVETGTQLVLTSRDDMTFTKLAASLF